MASPRVFRFGVTLLPIMLLVSPPALRADTRIKVSTTADDTAINGNCTLREAIIAANTDAAVDGCPAGSGGDRIILRAGTYLLSVTGPNEDRALAGDLDILSEVTIEGHTGGATTIHGAWPDPVLSDRVFDVHIGPDVAHLTLSHVTVSGGRVGGVVMCPDELSGGGIRNRAYLTLLDSILQGNVVDEFQATIVGTWDSCGWERFIAGGGAISNGDPGVLLTMVRSSVIENTVASRDLPGGPGGGLLNRGSADISLSRITRNSASGAAITNYGRLQVVDTEVSLNRGDWLVSGETTGIDNSGVAEVVRTTIIGEDGGVVNKAGTLTVLNTTVSGSRGWFSWGSVTALSGTVDVVSSTIANNTSFWSAAGIAGRVRLMNTIVSNPGYRDCLDPPVSLGNNLDLDGSCHLQSPGDLSNTDPLLGPLADNGGPTLTHALLPGSPALDHIPDPDCAVAADQRGVVRPHPKRGACDVGAYEFSPPGDILLIAQDVQDLIYRPLTPPEAISLQESLKAAYRAASTGDAPGTCLALDAFSMSVSDYVSRGILSEAEAQPLLDAAHRVQVSVCS